MAIREKRAVRRQRLEAAGLWDRYCRCRDLLKQAGFEAPEAGLLADEAFAEGNRPPEEEQLTDWVRRKVGDAVERSGNNAAAGAAAGADEAASNTVTQLGGDIDEAYLPLIQAGIGRNADMRARVEWVLANLLLPVEQIDRNGVPDCAAVTLLEWARSSTMARTEFMSKFALKLTPNKAEDKEAESLEDDGRELEELLEQFQRGADPVLSAGAERSVA